MYPGSEKKSVFERLDAAMGELYALHDEGRLRVIHEDYARALSADAISDFEETHGPLPSGLAEIYRSVGSIDIEWETPIDPDRGIRVRGALKLPTLKRMYGDWKDALWFDFSPPDSPCRTLRPLDRFTPEWWAVLRPGDPQVFLHEAGIATELHPTGLDIPHWLDLAIEARFHDGWLFTCVERPGQTAAHSLDEMVRDMLGLFPRIDLSRFRAPRIT